MVKSRPNFKKLQKMSFSVFFCEENDKLLMVSCNCALKIYRF